MTLDATAKAIIELSELAQKAGVGRSFRAPRSGRRIRVVAITEDLVFVRDEHGEKLALPRDAKRIALLVDERLLG